jgi:hypothetical protein
LILGAAETNDKYNGTDTRICCQLFTVVNLRVTASQLKVDRWIKQDEETRPSARVDAIRLVERNQLNHRLTSESQANCNIGSFFDKECNDRARSQSSINEM